MDMNVSIACQVLNGTTEACGFITPDGNVTFIDEEAPQIEDVPLFIVLLGFCFITVFGNSLVILAVIRERTLHSVTNYMILSLAVADTIVGLVVMPLSATLISMDQKWPFGLDWCDLWHSIDVLASTASILNLCVISIDRYTAITDPIHYSSKMTCK